MLADLAQRGVDVCSLLVVPDYHHSGSATADAEFTRWLRNLEADGHEIVIHGYFHERARKAGEGWGTQLITQTYTSGEGEFYDVGYDEALRLITRARDEFHAAGLRPHGFIAPAWLLSGEAERAAADAEMEYTTRLTGIIDLRRGRTFPARSLVYSTRSGWRRSTSLAWNGTLARLQAAQPLVRLGVHPPDLAHPKIWSQIASLAGAFTKTRTATTYRDWMNEWRARDPADS